MAGGKIGTGIAKPLRFRQNIRSMTTLSNNLRISGQKGFTLIELLVVIAIIGLISGMVIGLAGSSSSKKQRKLTEAKLSKIVSAIEAYRIDKGHFPPVDSAYNQSAFQLKANAHYTSLFYELTGTRFDGASTYQSPAFQPSVNLSQAALQNAFGNAIPGFVNSVQGTARENQYFAVSSSKDYWVTPNIHQITSATHPTPVALLHVSAPSWKKGLTTNFWNYRLLAPDSHNPNSYDLWAEIRGKKPGLADKEVIGNWNMRN
ncbi:MAG: prepilin-type N-terminal cleavage/methylation domain-containing protein [Limisphaerales bacterium]|jgi:prepilin-type N-terminal cleavage/methylation domain-containing protein